VYRFPRTTILTFNIGQEIAVMSGVWHVIYSNKRHRVGGKVKGQTPFVEKTAENKSSNGRSKKRIQHEKLENNESSNDDVVIKKFEREEFIREKREDADAEKLQDSKLRYEDRTRESNTKKPNTLNRREKLILDTDE
jgi:hypothetical protein